MSSVVKVKDQITQIATAVEEQSAAAEEITRNIEDTARISSQIEKLAESIAKDSYEILKVSSDLRHTTSSVKTDKTQQMLFEIFKSDHERMLSRVYAHLRGIEKLDPDRLADYQSCGIATWCNSGDAQKVKDLPVFYEFIDTHKKYHLLSKEIVIAHKS
ncbi:MAG: chemotaxis protein, partial [Thermodesulfovibrio sp.]|nr:chemotaxis protein [Thermodesulfovibrio sp.]